MKTLIELEAELKELKTEEAKAWAALEEAKKALAPLEAAWLPIYRQKQKLETLIEAMKG